MLQYIGARYVPIFYQNSQDPTSSEWELNVTYEPMTWVELSNGHMYISKKEVPANIGSPASNPEYWLEAGQYNAYIQHLQDQIDDMNDGTVSGSLQNQINEMNDGTVPGSLQNQISSNSTGISNINTEITNMKNGSLSGSLQNQINSNDVDIAALQNAVADDNVILIGDSYAVDQVQYSGGVGWETRAQATFTNAVKLNGGGAGFDTTTNPFQSLLANATIADHSKITQILVLGGANDAIRLHSGASSESTIRTAIQNFFTYAKAQYPNAKIKVGFIGNHQNPAENRFDDARDIYKSQTFAEGGIYYSGGERILENYSMSSDTLHPTQRASNMFGEFAKACLFNAPYSVDYLDNADASLAWGPHVSATSGIHFETKWTDEGCDIIIKASAFGGVSVCQLAYDAAYSVSNKMHVCDLNHAPIYRDNLVVPVAVGTGGGYWGPGVLIYNGRSLYVQAVESGITANTGVLFTGCVIHVPFK